MKVVINPKKLRGEIEAIASKSFAHRILIGAGLSQSPTEIRLNALSEDILATISCLEQMGASIEQGDGFLKVFPIQKPVESPVLDCNESGSTARFLLPVAAAVLDSFTLTGKGRLPERPFSPICREMRNKGCIIETDKLPINVRGKLSSGDYYIEGNSSSQFISGLLFALPLLEGDSRIILTTPLQSVGYVDMTIEVLSLFGIEAEKTESGYFVKGGQKYLANSIITVEGDWSNAAFYLSINALCGGVFVTGLNKTSTQGDRAITDVLKSLSDNNKANPLVIDVSQIPDLAPVIAVVASLTEGTTHIVGGQRLRIKESDRIATTYEMLKTLGALIEMTEDGFVIKGVKSLKGGEVSGAGDHRIVMAAATAAVKCQNPVIINGAEAVNKSYPKFFKDYEAIGGDVCHLI